MKLSHFESMDPAILLSIVNMKMRDEFESLDDLVKYYEIDKDKLVQKLESAGFEYLEDAKQFR